jgi:hypothetical protein
MFQKPKRETQLGIGGSRPKNQAISCGKILGCKSYTGSEEAAESLGFLPFALRSCLARSSNRVKSSTFSGLRTLCISPSGAEKGRII